MLYPADQKPDQRIRPDLLGTVIPAEHGTLVRWAVPADKPPTPLHSHGEYEQITVVLEGRLQTEVDGKSYTMRPGDILRIDRGVVHGNTIALDGCEALVLDVFMPPRQQYLDAVRFEEARQTTKTEA